MKKPDWLPNWRKADEYPDPATTTSQQWAWEFLRRNCEYQADYNELVLFRENDNPEINKFANEAINSLYGGPIQFTTGTSPLPIAFLIEAYDLLRVMYKEKENYSWMPEVCWRLVAKYNLRRPLDPALPYQTEAFIECDKLPVIETTALIMHPIKIPDDRKLTISVDMDGPLEDQLKYLKGFFSAYGKQSRMRKSEYVDCLRFLDGEGDAPWNFIAKELNKTRTTYDKMAKKAKKLLYSDFLALSQSKLIPGEGNRLKQGQSDGKMFFETNALAPSMRQSFPRLNSGGYYCLSLNDTVNETVIHLKPNLPPSRTA